MRFEGAGRGKTKYHVHFFSKFRNFVSDTFILPAIRTPLISVEQSAFSPWTEEPCDLQDSFKDTLHTQHTLKAFESFGISLLRDIKKI